MIRIIFALAVLTNLLGSPAIALTVSAFPSDETVRTLESQIVMPPSAGALADYTRYYFLAPDDWYPGHRVVAGMMNMGRDDERAAKFAKPLEGVPGAYISDHPVMAAVDGGCSYVTLAYDLDTQKMIAGPVCNGVA